MTARRAEPVYNEKKSEMKTSVLFLSLFVSLGSARQDPEVCATHALRSREEMFLHQRFSAARRGGPLANVNRDIGQIAVIEDSDGVIGRRNPFNLNQKTLTFSPANAAATGYGFQLGAVSYDPALVSSGQHLTLKDDDSQAVTLPFPFPFFGATYDQIYINSDGNLTFMQADSASADRSLGRFTAGPPRIAPLFTDLDPSISTQGVVVNSEANRFVVTWAAVPVYTSTGTGAAQTFQVRLYPNGRIEFTWANTSLTDAVVGIAPGRLQGPDSIVSFLQGSGQQFTGAVAERFSGADAIDIVTASQKFFETHEDSYDYLVIFNNEGVQSAPGAVAYETTVRNSRTGYGDDLVDDGQEYGSSRRLQSVLNMGPLSQYPLDPNAVVPARGITGDTTLTVIGHETGHLFLAFVSVPDPKDPKGKPMLGRSLVHWSFLFNSEASLLEGNRIQDNGPAARLRFLTTGTVEGYAPLDQYLMGFRRPDEVSPTFLVFNSPNVTNAAQAPQRGVAFNGERRDISIQEVIEAAGRRTPDSTVAQRNFRFAFLLIVPAGSTPDPAQVAQLEAYRSRFETAYVGFTSNRASADASLRRAVHLSAFPAAGVLIGSAASASITLDSPVTAPLRIGLRSDLGLITTPAFVEIPPGANNIKFSISGIRAGVDKLTAEPVDTSYETAVANIQIADGASSLKLEVVSGANQAATAGRPLAAPVIFKLTDVNDLPYAGVKLITSLNGGGTVSSEVLTDEAGLARVSWTPGIGPVNELTVSIAGGPSLTVAALASPLVANNGVVNAASFATGISPNAFATIFGSSLAGASVQVNGKAVSVSYSDNRQVNFLVPADVPGPSATVNILNAAGLSVSVVVPVIAIQPGLFAAVQRGLFVEIYGTGFGSLNGAQQTTNVPAVSVGGVSAKVSYSGVAPGFPGLYQVDAILPNGAVAGSPVVISIAGQTSNSVSLR